MNKETISETSKGINSADLEFYKLQRDALLEAVKVHGKDSIIVIKQMVEYCLEDARYTAFMKEDFGLTCESVQEVNIVNSLFAKKDVDGLVNFFVAKLYIK